MVKAKPNQKFHVDKLASALDTLDKLESKPKEELTLRESIYFLRGKLNSALKKGYNYEDLSEILAEQEILVSAATLKLYLTEGSKSKKSSTRRKKSQSSSNPVLSTNITDSKEELETGNSDAEINRMKEQSNSESAVNLKVDSTTGTKSSTANSKKAKAKPSSQSSGNRSSSTKTNVLSGRSDDLSSEFNSF
ncbi:conserved hypothetical protein [Hyella patelloides LEGE 07179]|uniref:Mobilization protein MobC n=1 Tax=Hyella patelloides LEGE 07179 TaxID=945734 RepID=A0A563VXD4_9CYAN|nr:hypothetical protein [Hyella patelloides]VEP16112.1 conserved hypothetical protein [Hyella patelloides LEGE 07179]